MTISQIAKFWHKWSWLGHFISVIFLAGVAWAGVTSQEARITRLEEKSVIATNDIAGIKQDTAVIKESLRWIERTMGRK